MTFPGGSARPLGVDNSSPRRPTKKASIAVVAQAVDALLVCDAYLVIEVIHAWGDVDAVEFLRVRRAAPSAARILVIEQMIPDHPSPHWAKTDGRGTPGSDAPDCPRGGSAPSARQHLVDLRLLHQVLKQA